MSPISTGTVMDAPRFTDIGGDFAHRARGRDQARMHKGSEKESWDAKQD